MTARLILCLAAAAWGGALAAEESIDALFRDVVSSRLEGVDIPSGQGAVAMDAIDLDRETIDAVRSVLEERSRAVRSAALGSGFSQEFPVGDATSDSVLRQAISDLPEAEAREILALIEGRTPRNEGRLNARVDVPSLGAVSAGLDRSAQSIFLADWSLHRTPRGEPAIMRRNDVNSRIVIREGMVLGAFGRVSALHDTTGRFEVHLETGDVISGMPRARTTSPGADRLDSPTHVERDPSAAAAGEADDPANLPATATEPGDAARETIARGQDEDRGDELTAADGTDGSTLAPSMSVRPAYRRAEQS